MRRRFCVIDATVGGCLPERYARDLSTSDSAGAVVSLSAQYMDLRFGEFLLLLLALSSLASALGTTNFTARVAFSWGRHRYLPPLFARTHPRFKTPHVALAALAATTLVVYLVGLIWQGNTLIGGLTYFSWLLLCGAWVGVLQREVSDPEQRQLAARRAPSPARNIVLETSRV